MPLYNSLLMIRRASRKLENSFVTAHLASARAQLSRLEHQRVLPPNCGQIMKKQQLFIFPNSLTIHQTSTLYNTFYFNNTWTKIQLRSDPVNMQPDKNKCYLQRPITTLWPAASKMLSTSSGSPPSEQWDIIITHKEELQNSEGGCMVLECHISHLKAAGMSWCSQANIRRRKGKMWWLIEICINCVVHRSFDGYHELNGDWKLCRCQVIAGYFWIHCQYGNFKGRTYFRPCKHAWLQMKIYGPKLEPRSKLGHEKRRALESENSAESEHYSLHFWNLLHMWMG